MSPGAVCLGVLLGSSRERDSKAGNSPANLQAPEEAGGRTLPPSSTTAFSCLLPSSPTGVDQSCPQHNSKTPRTDRLDLSQARILAGTHKTGRNNFPAQWSEENWWPPRSSSFQQGQRAHVPAAVALLPPCVPVGSPCLAHWLCPASESPGGVTLPENADTSFRVNLAQDLFIHCVF